MKKIYSSLFLLLFAVCMKATSYTVTISGFSYSPATLTVSVGDVVTIQASGMHPLAEVSQTTWVANGTTTLSSGFGVKNSDYTFTITANNPIYYVCQVHAGSGMKGQLVPASTSTGLTESTLSLNSISLFPNPAKNTVSMNLNAETNGLLNAKLFSLCGQELQLIFSNKEINKGSNTLSMDLQVPSGIYFVEFNYNSERFTRKLIIE